MRYFKGHKHIKNIREEGKCRDSAFRYAVGLPSEHLSWPSAAPRVDGIPCSSQKLAMLLPQGRSLLTLYKSRAPSECFHLQELSWLHSWLRVLSQLGDDKWSRAEAARLVITRSNRFGPLWWRCAVCGNSMSKCYARTLLHRYLKCWIRKVLFGCSSSTAAIRNHLIQRSSSVSQCHPFERIRPRSFFTNIERQICHHDWCWWTEWKINEMNSFFGGTFSHFPSALCFSFRLPFFFRPSINIKNCCFIFLSFRAIIIVIVQDFLAWKLL